ncbi:unnamed protein product [Rotaria magnacalcarata]|uniref:Uncharacterized protein n=1 Tax=Rotaria magnacalcarata TaxID=392030 RepID=A0A816LEG5_9BILA|nr:unnamed protein product [Rotaria magnacalcarata]
MASPSDHKYSSNADKNANQSNGHIQPNESRRYNPWGFENPWSHGLCNSWCMNESCWITCCLPGYLAVLRTKMRTAFRIKGSYFSDFFMQKVVPVVQHFKWSVNYVFEG